ncbi:hypothetical protein FJT64_009234 [Amphibalanus amphitrite]|uniref:Uncharacterized protein n=1 Tax=Amphibalanus amphitrite TaxID=1232801 RepID=A0A6A4VQ97_AMPAM|nr:hypothetical protein FJT64_009234 [Amphibalanus amphitrite]
MMARGEGAGEGQGAGAGRDDGGAIWSLVWLIILILVSFFIAGFCAGWYIIFSIFTPCIEQLKPVTDILLVGVNFPHMCSQNILSGKPIG